MTNIVIIGVGGQGTLLASRILGAYAQLNGLDVKVSEVHGMAQRGGSVVTFVRMGEVVFSPLCENGGADYVIACERLEAARALTYLKSDGVMIMSTQAILPMPVVLGSAQYPDNIVENIANVRDVVALGALNMAIAAGSVRAVNCVLIGALAKRMGGAVDIWLNALKSCVPEKSLEMNTIAFMSGYNA